MSPDEPELDAIVIGGGPAGSTVATLLAMRGRRVALLERERFPRAHVGESLLPATVPILEALGVRDAVDAAGFLTKHGATMVWGSDPEPWSWYFRETNRSYPSSYQVWRPDFDRILLDRSRELGVDVREGHHVTEVRFEGERATGVRFRTDFRTGTGTGTGTSDGTVGNLEATFVVDASGQSGLLASKLGLRTWDSFFQNLAIYAYYEGAERLPEPDATNIFIESYAQGWFWLIPLHTGQMSVGVVLDSQRGQELLADASVEEVLEAQIRLAPRTARMLSAARRTDGPHVVKDWSYVPQRFVGDGYLLVGDAACFVDPLFSSGVHLAMSAGVLASAYIDAVLRDPSMREPAAEVYRQQYESQYWNFHELARLFYSSNRSAESYFWEARRLGDEEEFSPRHAFIRAVAGQSPLGYERAVLSRGEPPAAFVRSVQALEQERSDRGSELEAAPAGALSDAVPVLAADVRVERKPVLADGSFEWGSVISSPARPEGAACSPLVARLLLAIDGERSVSGLITAVEQSMDTPPDERQRAAIVSSVLETVRILYVDGTIEALRGL